MALDTLPLFSSPEGGIDYYSEINGFSASNNGNRLLFEADAKDDIRGRKGAQSILWEISNSPYRLDTESGRLDGNSGIETFKIDTPKNPERVNIGIVYIYPDGRFIMESEVHRKRNKIHGNSLDRFCREYAIPIFNSLSQS